MNKSLKEIALDDLVNSSRALYFQNLEEKHFGTAKKMQPDPNGSPNVLLQKFKERLYADYMYTIHGYIDGADYLPKKPVAPKPSAFEKQFMKPASFVLPDTKPVKFHFEFTKSGIVVRKETDNVAMEMRSGKNKLMEQMLAYMDPQPTVLLACRATRSPAQTVAVANPSNIKLETPQVLLEQMERVAKDIDLIRSLSLTCGPNAMWSKYVLPVKSPRKF